jgi:hypothetical protein
MEAVELLWIAIIGGGLAWLMLASNPEPDEGSEPEPPPTPVHAERRHQRPPTSRTPLSRREEESRWREIIKRLES